MPDRLFGAFTAWSIHRGTIDGKKDAERPVAFSSIPRPVLRMVEERQVLESHISLLTLTEPPTHRGLCSLGPSFPQTVTPGCPCGTPVGL